jgi:AraC-like DNA-binding protein
VAVDLLSDVIATMRIGRPSAARATVGTSGWSFAGYHGVGFHIVLEGQCWLVTERGGQRWLGAGDVVLLPHGTSHALAFGRAEPPTAAEVAEFRAFKQVQRMGNIQGPISDSARGTAGTGPARGPAGTGPAGAGTDVLCGKYRCDPARTHPLVREMPDVVHIRPRLGRHAGLRSAVELLAGEAGSAEGGAEVLTTSLLDAIFVYLLRAWLDERTEEPAGAGPGGWRAALADPLCRSVLHAMHSDPSQPWSIQTLSRQAGVSRATLARRFAALVGQSPMAYLTWWRMTTATRLLRTGDASLEEIASRVGYASAFAFAHAFKREFGLAPGRFRASEAEAQEYRELRHRGAETQGAETRAPEAPGPETQDSETEGAA